MQDGRRPPIGSSRPLSRQAVASAIASSLLCCPLFSVIGMVLGWRALRAIRRSDGAVRGRGWALLGFYLGLGAIAVQLIALSYAGSSMQALLVAETQSQIARVFSETDVPAEEIWTRMAGRRVSTPQVSDTIAEALRRYGQLRAAQVQPPFSQAGGLGSMQMTAPVTLHFENATVLGGVEIQIAPRGINPWGSVRLARITISDARAGDLVIPPK